MYWMSEAELSSLCFKQRLEGVRVAFDVMRERGELPVTNSFEEAEHPRDAEGKFQEKGESARTETKEDPRDKIFGAKFSEYSYKPEESIEKLLKEKTGYVPAAIKRDEIGDIDFVYGKEGKKGYGLAHIVEKHGTEILKRIPDIIKTGKIDDTNKMFGRININTDKERVVIKLIWDSEKVTWMTTAFEQDEDYKKQR